jgi:hypothetical protein
MIVSAPPLGAMRHEHAVGTPPKMLEQHANNAHAQRRTIVWSVNHHFVLHRDDDDLITYPLPVKSLKRLEAAVSVDSTGQVAVYTGDTIGASHGDS